MKRTLIGSVFLVGVCANAQTAITPYDKAIKFDKSISQPGSSNCDPSRTFEAKNQRLQIAKSIELLRSRNVIIETENGEAIVNPDIFDALKSEGLIKTEDSKASSICVGPIKD